MPVPPVVPYVPILRRYHEAIALPDRARHALATQLADDPDVLATEFLTSVALLAEGYDNAASFHPVPRVPRPAKSATIATGTDVAWHVHRQRGLPVQDDPELNVDWVEYELSILGTRGGAVFDQPIHGAAPSAAPAKAGGPLKVDLVLANAVDRTPVFAEVKVRKDKDPFSALVQLLAYIAHGASPSQYARVRTHLPTAAFPEAYPPRFDGYILLHDFGSAPSTWLEPLLAQSRRISESLTKNPALRPYLRRIAVLDLHLERGELAATTRWRHDS